ncbi:MAG: tetratricopeptide repeat protein [Microscillaceae bacterium]|jgi:tetratricopeptide (TPR) repeat protein|nr:tetratricopeptide repeat protein [Microscillaceae bacterium]
MYKILGIVLFIWAGLTNLPAQEKSNLQKLHEALGKTKDTDTLRVAILGDIAIIHYQKFPDSTLIYADKSLQLAQTQKFLAGIAIAYFLKGLGYQVKEQIAQAILQYEEAKKYFSAYPNPKFQSQTLNNLAILYQDQGNLSKALQIHQENLKIKEKLNDQVGIANAYSNMGNLYDIQSDYSKALEYHLKALRIREKIQDQNGIATSYLNLGNVYNMLKTLDLAIESYTKALEANEPLKNNRRKALILNNLAAIYHQQDSLDKALLYYQSALEINTLLKAKEASADNLNNIALIFKKKQAFDQAQEYFEKALRLTQEIGNKEKTAIYLNNIADNFSKQKQWDKAFEYAKRGYELAKSIPAKIPSRNALKIMAEAKYALKDGTNAYDLQSKMFAYHDSIFNETSIRQMNELTTKYETEKKEKEIELLNKQQKINQLALNEQTALTEKKQIALSLLGKEKELQTIEFEKVSLAKEAKLTQITQAKQIQAIEFDKKEKERLANINLLKKENTIKSQVIENQALRTRNLMLFSGLGILLVGAIVGYLFLRQRQRLHLETEKRLRENIIHQFDNLKNQISPHFLLNSLTALHSLIAQKPEKAQKFTHEMAKVYRYVLQLKDNLLVQLKEELELSQAYISLQKMRFGENLQISLSIDEAKLNNSLPPLSLQLLLENAIKHNDISAENPLKINILDDDEFLIISNNLQTKTQKEQLEEETATHIGLKNLTERYRLVGEKKPSFKVSQHEYIVKLPLIVS